MRKEVDDKVYRELFDNYYETLVMFANHFLNDLEAAEDVVQDCFLDFWEKKRLEQLSENDILEKYIFSSVKHAALNNIRSNKRREERQMTVIQNSDSDFGAESNDLSDEETEYLYRIINLLPKDRKRIFTMICIEGKKYREVADILGISMNTVKTQMGRAFQFLRNSLEKDKFSMFMFLLCRPIL